MNRYFLRLSYIGTAYNGWQKQPHSKTVQQTLEEALYTFLRFPIELTGCGRTDTGVHARDYIAHFDFPQTLNIEEVIYKANKILPLDIAINDIYQVKQSAHARFDALSRAYEYRMHIEKNPFAKQSYYYTYETPNLEKLNEAAKLLLEYTDFYTFCKENTDVKTTLCHIAACQWTENQGQYLFTITANRFLRGMIRLIVGMCLDISRSQISIEEVRHALDNKSRLIRNWSVPADGLTLFDIKYDLEKIKIST